MKNLTTASDDAASEHRTHRHVAELVCHWWLYKFEPLTSVSILRRAYLGPPN